MLYNKYSGVDLQGKDAEYIVVRATKVVAQLPRESIISVMKTLLTLLLCFRFARMTCSSPSRKQPALRGIAVGGWGTTAVGCWRACSGAEAEEQRQEQRRQQAANEEEVAERRRPPAGASGKVDDEC